MIAQALISSFLAIASTVCFAQQYGSFKDPRDGRVYKTVKIGTQVWMAENLNAERFRNGDTIPEAKTSQEWEKASQEGKPAWCYYNNDTSHGKTLGKLYNWYVITDKRNIAPLGWNVPSEDDFTTLLYAVNDDSELLYKPNSYGFNVMFAGDRNNSGEFYNLSQSSHLWSSSMANSFHAKYLLLGPYDGYSPLYDDNLGAGFSLRLIKETSKEEIELINGITYMKHNLSSNEFRNGDTLRLIKSKSEWLNAWKNKIPAYCYYNFDPAMHDIGYIYNYYAFIDKRNIAPTGFRLLTEDDILPENLSIKRHGGTLAGVNGNFFGLDQETLFWSLCINSSILIDKFCFWKVLPDNSPIFFDKFHEGQGMYIRCIKE